VSSLEALGWNGFFQEQITSELAGLRMARVVEEQRGLCRVAGAFDGWAELGGHLRHEIRSAADLPAIGDWVGVSAEQRAERAVIRCRLQRRSTVSRKAAGRAVDEQVLAANVDTIFIVTAFTADLNPRRIERYLTLVWEAGAVPVVVLNKSDLSEDPSAAAAATRARLPLVDVLSVSGLSRHGLDELGPYLKPAATVALLGSSGVGKSTLINGLLGHDLQRVSAVSDGSGKGRHTTTARQLVELPGGALLIDTPGMRELQPWVDESAIDGVFEDVSQLARACRFADCGHAGEPGCAVLEAVSSGTLDASRLEHYRRLLREAAFEERKRDKSAAAEEKRRWKRINQSMKERYRERERER
jgi:ribosome biogenesis GTPase / thiamine phosphate phosphatase